MSLLEGLADPHSPELADQRVLPRQPALVVLHDDADDLRKEGWVGSGRLAARQPGFSRAHLDGLELQVQSGGGGGRRSGPDGCRGAGGDEQRDEAVGIGSQHVSERLGVFVFQETLQGKPKIQILHLRNQ